MSQSVQLHSVNISIAHQLLIVTCDGAISGKYSYTYRHTTLGHSSFIDHFFVNKSFYDCISSGDIVDSGVNFSDHLAIVIDGKIDVVAAKSGNVNTGTKSAGEKHFRLRWDKADIASYYDYTYRSLSNIDIDSFDDCQFSVTRTDDLCIQIVECLEEAARLFVPRTTCHVFKHWWNASLDALKNDSICTHRLWVANGSPRSGSIYDTYRKAKAAYKLALRQAEKDNLLSVSNDLHDYLIEKDHSGFWRLWSAKFGDKKHAVSVVDGIQDAKTIAGRFADVFEKACTVNNKAISDKLRNKFISEFNSYAAIVGKKNVCINIELIDQRIRDMKVGRAAGPDGIEVEHILYSHPILVVLLHKLFNAILQHGYVPSIFCRGIIIPLLKNKQGCSSDITNYRGITLSSAIAKLFEMCTLSLYQDFLITSDLQFGFKKSLGCNHAIYAVRSVCEYYASRSSTVNICLLDMSKAFDKVDHCALYLKLMKRNTPLEFLNVLINWYSRCDAFVNWNGTFSRVFRTVCGVRQGGVLSPLLFAVYVDDLIGELKGSGLGCHIGSMYFGCIMYADDLVILAASLTMLQAMIDLCDSIAKNELNMSFNVKKSAIVRVGPAFRHLCASVILNGSAIDQVESARYLGIHFRCGKYFRLSTKEPKGTFYRAVNALCSKTKCKLDDMVMLHLVTSFCRPLLVYGAECIKFTPGYDNALKSSWNYVFWKIFHVSDALVEDVSQFTRTSTLSSFVLQQRIKFRQRMSRSSNTSVRFLYDLFGARELFDLMS